MRWVFLAFAALGLLIGLLWGYSDSQAQTVWGERAYTTEGPIEPLGLATLNNGWYSIRPMSGDCDWLGPYMNVALGWSDDGTMMLRPDGGSGPSCVVDARRPQLLVDYGFPDAVLIDPGQQQCAVNANGECDITVALSP